MSAGLRPHQFLTLAVGSGRYTFRTFAFAEVFYADRALRETWRALRAAQADPAQAEGVIAPMRELFGIVCPELALSEDYLHLTPTHYGELTKFYLRQDWRRLEHLLTLGSAATPENYPKGQDGAIPEAEQVFLIMCATTARYFNMSTVEFASLRFEDGCDMVVTMFRVQEANGERNKILTPAEAFDNLVTEFGGANQVEGMGPIFPGMKN